VFRKGKIFKPRSWWRALTGQIDYKNLKDLVSFQARNFLFGQKPLLPNSERFFATLYPLTQKGVDIQFVISGGKDPKNSFNELLKDKFRNRQFAGKVFSEVVDHSDHTFTSLGGQPQLFQVIQNFVLKYSGKEHPRGQIRSKETPTKLVGI
jgi:hypothetical protein